MQEADPPRDNAQRQDDARRRDAAREHDAAHKVLYSHPRMVADLLRGFLPEGAWPELDHGTLERLTASHVGRGLARREGDLMWRLRDLGASDGGWVHVLLEFESGVDRHMALRVLTYAGLAWEGTLRAGIQSGGGRRPGKPRGEAGGGGRPGGPLPPVIPFVVYNGDAPWTAPADVAELVAPVSGRGARVQPSNGYYLLDLQRADVGQLPGDNAAGLQAALEQTAPDRSAPALRRLEAALAGPGHEGLRRAFAKWLRWSCRRWYGAFAGGDAALGRELDRMENAGEVLKMRSLAAERWKERNRRNEARIRARALERGLMQGRAEGLELKRRLLGSLAARRFGADAGERLSALLAGVTEPELLEAVGGAIIDCGSNAELLSAARRIAGVVNSAG